MTLNELFEAAVILQSHFVDDATGNGWYSGQDDFGYEAWNHWSSALEVLKERLERRLTNTELCVFSLSLDFGPTPGIDAVCRARWSGVLFPRRNMSGGALSPLKVIRRLAWSERDEKLEMKVNNLLNPPAPAVRLVRAKFSADSSEVK